MFPVEFKKKQKQLRRLQGERMRPTCCMCSSSWCRGGGNHGEKATGTRGFKSIIFGLCTEHERPTKTILLQALRLLPRPGQARLCSHQRQRQPRQPIEPFQTEKKGARDGGNLWRRGEEIKNIMDKGRWQSASRGPRIIPQRSAERERFETKSS